MRQKSKFIAFLLSFIPGLSHFYIGYGERGVLYLLLTGAACGGSIIMLYLTSSGLFAVTLFMAYAIIWLIGLIDAFNLIGRMKYGREYASFEEDLETGEFSKMNKKMITLGLSLIPGAGHMYLGYQKKGLAYMTLFFFTIFFMGWLNLSFLLFLVPIIWFYAFFDAFHTVSGNTVEDMEIDILDLLPKINHEYIGIGFIVLGVVIAFQKMFLPAIDIYLNYQIRNFIQTSIVSLIFVFLGILMIRKKKNFEEEGLEGEEEDYED